jgi:hypothetical protein
VIGHLYPQTFGWVIKTGSAIDRAQLATACGGVRYTPRMQDEVLTALRARDLPTTPYASLDSISGLIKATVQGLRREKGVNHGNQHPKGKERIEAEAVVIETILRVGMRRLRESERS